MTRRLIFALVGLVACAAVATVRSAEVEPVEVAQVSTMTVSGQMASMQAELDEMRARFEQVSFGGEVGCSKCGKGKCDGCGASCGCNCFCNIGCGGVYGGAEAVIVRPHFGHEIDYLGPGAGVPNGTQVDPSFNYSASPRIFLGWRNCRGTGIRARYWYFNQSVSLANPVILNEDLLTSGLKVQALDLEFTQLVCLGPVNTNFAFGVRYGSVQNTLQGFSQTQPEDFKLRTQFDGWGPTLAMQNRIPLGCSNFSVVGNLRGSLLFGNTHYTVWGQPGGRFAVGENGGEETVTDGRQDVVAVGELQVGLQWARSTNYGIVSAYALLEGQYWAGATSNLLLDAVTWPATAYLRGVGTSESLGFVGGTVGIQIAR